MKIYKKKEEKKRELGIGIVSRSEVVKKILPIDITISQVSINQQLPEPPLSETASRMESSRMSFESPPACHIENPASPFSAMNFPFEAR